MPKVAALRSETWVKAQKSDGRYAVGGAVGLYLLVIGDARSWVLRIKIGNRRTDIGLGSCRDVSLAQARKRASELREQYAETGAIVTPKAEIRAKAEAERIAADKRKTFAECAGPAIELKTAGLKNPKHKAQWGSTLETYAYPIIGNKPVGSITKHDIVAVLEPIWTAKHETARRVRGRMEAVLDYAKSMGYREGDNPAEYKGNLEALLGKVKKKPKNQPALPHLQIGAFMAELRKREGNAARALEFAILTVARSTEVRMATWHEFDFDACVWTIPEGRMKASVEHEVPLSEAAIALLKALPRVKGNSFVFVGTSHRGNLSENALLNVVKSINGDKPKFVDRRLKEPVVPHGFRSTFREWAGEVSGHSPEVIEHALAHRLPDAAERAYQRGTLLPRRVQLMEDWANRCSRPDTKPNNVVALKGAA